MLRLLKFRVITPTRGLRHYAAPARAHKTWTAEEDQLLRHQLNERKLQDVKIEGRTYFAIKARYYHLKADPLAKVRHAWSEHDHHRLATLYAQGKPVVSLAAALEVSEMRVSARIALLRRTGRLARRQSVLAAGVAFSEDQDKRLLGLYSQGVSILNISQAMAITRNAIRARLRSLGASVHVNRFTIEVDAHMLKLHHEGMQPSAISEIIGVAPASIRARVSYLQSRFGLDRHSVQWNEEQDSEILRLHQAGESLSNMGNAVHKTRNHVRDRLIRLCRERGLYCRVSSAETEESLKTVPARKNSKSRWQEGECAAVIKLHKEGKTSLFIAHALDRTEPSVLWKIATLRARGQMPASQRQWTEEDRERALKMFEDGRSYSEIAESVGRSVSATGRVLHQQRCAKLEQSLAAGERIVSTELKPVTSARTNAPAGAMLAPDASVSSESPKS